MDYQPTMHEFQQAGMSENSGLCGFEQPHVHEKGMSVKNCRLCREKAAKAGTDLNPGADESVETDSADRMNDHSDHEEYFSAVEEQPTSEAEENTAESVIELEKLNLQSSERNGSEINYYHGNSLGSDLVDHGDGPENISGERLTACTWQKFSRGVARRPMPQNIPRTKITDEKGVEKECPLVPELKLTTPEEKEYWLEDLTYYSMPGGWADLDDEEEAEDESIYD
ncbi:hypothetical protein V8F20_011305 [Naviculisporaceae sp. PSN 640]